MQTGETVKENSSWKKPIGLAKKDGLKYRTKRTVSGIIDIVKIASVNDLKKRIGPLDLWKHFYFSYHVRMYSTEI